MVDFLKANPAFSMQDVMWNLSVPMVKIMMADASQVIYLTDKQKKKYKAAQRKSNKKIYNDSNLDEFEKELSLT